MKKIMLKIQAYYIVFLLMMFVSVAAMAQGDVPGDETNWPVVIIGIVITIIEIVMRTIPNTKVTGIIGLVINLLKSISDYLNRGKDE